MKLQQQQLCVCVHIYMAVSTVNAVMKMLFPIVHFKRVMSTRWKARIRKMLLKKERKNEDKLCGDNDASILLSPKMQIFRTLSYVGLLD